MVRVHNTRQDRRTFASSPAVSDRTTAGKWAADRTIEGADVVTVDAKVS